MFHGVIQKIKVARVFIETRCSLQGGPKNRKTNTVKATVVLENRQHVT